MCKKTEGASASKYRIGPFCFWFKFLLCSVFATPEAGAHNIYGTPEKNEAGLDNRSDLPLF